MMDLQAQVVRLSITIHHIKLNVRFPCSLIFQIKSQNNVFESRKQHELVKGLCTPEQTIDCDLEVIRNSDGNYQQKPIKIIVYMNSANGRIPAGSVSVLLASQYFLNTQQITSSIEKCPDRTANMFYSISATVLKSLGEVDSQPTNSFNSSNSKYEYHSTSQNRPNFRHSAYRNNQMRSSHVKFNNNTDSLLSKGYRQKNQMRASGIHHTGSDYEVKKSRVSNSGGDMELARNSRMVDLERQNTDKIKQISRLKNQLFMEKGRDISEQHYSRLREQLQIMSAENQRLKQKIRSKQRHEKQLQNQSKQLRQELARKKQKTNQVQLQRIESESVLGDRERLIKQMQGQLRSYEQQISELKISLSTQQKRNQFKQSNFKQQLDKLNEKYQQSENQRQKATLQMNKMLQELEETEKRNQQTLRDKQKLFAEDRNKYSRKIETLNQTIESLREKIDQYDTNADDLLRNNKLFNSKVQELNQQLSECKNQFMNVDSMLAREKQSNKNLNRRLEGYERLQLDYKNLKKKHDQLLEQQNKLKKSLAQSQKQCLSHKNTIKSQQQQIYHKSQQLNTTHTTIANLTQQLNTTKIEQQNQIQQLQQLSMQKSKAQQLNQEFRNKIEQLQLAYNTFEMQTEEEINYMIKSKQYLESELEECRYNVGKYEEMLEEYEKKNKRNNDELLEVNMKLLESEEKARKYAEEASQCKTKISMLEEGQHKSDLKDRSSSQKLKQKTQQLHEATKKISRLETEIFMLKDKIQQNEKQFGDKLQTQQTVSKIKQTKIGELNQLIGQLQVQMLERDSIIEEKNIQNKNMANQLVYLREQLANTKKQVDGHTLGNKELSEQLRQLEEQLNSKDIELTLIKQVQEQTLKNNQNIQKQSQQIQQTYKAGFRQLLQEINRDSSVKELNLLYLPDEQLNLLQAEAIKKKNQIIINYQQDIKQLGENCRVLQEELDKDKQYYRCREEEMEISLEKEKNKVKNMMADSSLQSQQHHKTLQQLDDRIHHLTSQNQQLSIQNGSLKETIADLQSNLQQTNFINQSMDQQIKSLQSQIQRLQEQLHKTADSYENELSTKSEQNTLLFEKHKKIISESEKKLVELEKALLQREEEIIQYENRLVQMGHQQEIVEQKYAEINKRNLQLIENYQNGNQVIRSKQSEISDLESRVKELQNENSEQSRRYQQLIIQKSKLTQDLQQQQKYSTKKTQQLQGCQKELEQIKALHEDSSSKSKQSTQKNVQQIKKLKQDIIGLNGELDLKVFLIGQHESSLKNLKTANSEQNQQIQNKKIQIIELKERIQQLSNQNMQLAKNVQTLNLQLHQLEQQLIFQKDTVINLQDMVTESQTIAQGSAFKDRQISKLKEDITTKQNLYQKTTTQFKQSINQLKKQIASKTAKEQELRKRIRDLEKQLENQAYDLEAEKRNWEENLDNQKLILNQQIEEYKQINCAIAQELADAHREIDQFTTAINQKQISLYANAHQIQNLKNEVIRLNAELAKVREQWKSQKMAYVPTHEQMEHLTKQINRHQNYAKQLDNKNRQLIEIAKRRLNAQDVNKPTISETIRQILTHLMRTKTKVLMKYPTDKDKDQVISDFKAVQQKLESALRSSHALMR